MTDPTPARGVDAAAVAGIAARLQGMLSTTATFLAFPMAPIAYDVDDLRFMSGAGLDTRQAQTLAEFSELVNRVPAVRQVWSDDGTGRHLWDVYDDVLGAELAESARNTAEEQDYQRAYAYLHTVLPEPPDPPSPVMLEYQAAQLSYLAADGLWRSGKDGPDAEVLSEGKAAAWNAWLVGGHKDDVEEAMRVQSTLRDKDPSVAWSRYRTQFDPGLPSSFQTAPDGQHFVPTGFVPSGACDLPWPRLTMSRAELDAAASQAAPELSAALAEGASAGEITSVSFEYLPVDVTRPWFDPSMLTSRAWRFREGSPALSDGSEPPVGSCPAYVSRVVLARRISLTRAKKAGTDTAGGSPGLAFLEPGLLNLALRTTSVEPPGEPEPAQMIDAMPVEAVAISPLLLREESAAPVFARARPHSDLPTVEFASALTEPAVEALTPREQFVSAPAATWLSQQSVTEMSTMQRYDFALSDVTEQTPPPAPAPEETVETTPDGAVLIVALVCHKVGRAPDPDPTLPWPSG